MLSTKTPAWFPVVHVAIIITLFSLTLPPSLSFLSLSLSLSLLALCLYSFDSMKTLCERYNRAVDNIKKLVRLAVGTSSGWALYGCSGCGWIDGEIGGEGGEEQEK